MDKCNVLSWFTRQNGEYRLVFLDPVQPVTSGVRWMTQWMTSEDVSAAAPSGSISDGRFENGAESLQNRDHAKDCVSASGLFSGRIYQSCTGKYCLPFM